MQSIFTPGSPPKVIPMTRRLALLISLAAPLASLGAQTAAAGGAAAASGCPSETAQPLQPQPLGIAYLQRNKVVQAKTPDDAAKVIRDAMKLLLDDKNKS